MDAYTRLLLENKAWAAEKTEEDAAYFQKISGVKKPQFLWIGSSDSNVPISEITGTEPGEIFVHRNIANMVVHTDMNLLSVLQYAVEVLDVQHIIVCGHYGCGGIKAALSHQQFGLINKWIRNLKDIYWAHREELDALATEKEQLARLTELNVQEQVLNLAKTSIVQAAWQARKVPYLHGWVFNSATGLIEELVNMDPNTFELPDIYRYDFTEQPESLPIREQ